MSEMEGGEMGMRSELEEMQMKCDQVTDEVSALEGVLLSPGGYLYLKLDIILVKTFT